MQQITLPVGRFSPSAETAGLALLLEVITDKHLGQTLMVAGLLMPEFGYQLGSVPAHHKHVHVQYMQAAAD